jgi:hypothetical protein
VTSDGPLRSANQVADAVLATGEFIANDQLNTVIAYLDLIAECLVTLAGEQGTEVGRRLSEIRSGERGVPLR